MNEKEWLENNRHYNELDESKLTSIFYFTLIWNLFEKKCCNRNATIGTHPENISQSVSHLIGEEINRTYDYFRNRYILDTSTRSLFNSFVFGQGDKAEGYKNFVHEKLNDPDSSQNEKLKTLLYIAFRLRNNLYHGEKDVAKLYAQNENFKMINSLLMAIIDNCRQSSSNSKEE